MLCSRHISHLLTLTDLVSSELNGCEVTQFAVAVTNHSASRKCRSAEVRWDLWLFSGARSVIPNQPAWNSPSANMTHLEFTGVKENSRYYSIIQGGGKTAMLVHNFIKRWPIFNLLNCDKLSSKIPVDLIKTRHPATLWSIYACLLISASGPFLRQRVWISSIP